MTDGRMYRECRIERNITGRYDIIVASTKTLVAENFKEISSAMAWIDLDFYSEGRTREVKRT